MPKKRLQTSKSSSGQVSLMHWLRCASCLNAKPTGPVKDLLARPSWWPRMCKVHVVFAHVAISGARHMPVYCT